VLVGLKPSPYVAILMVGGLGLTLLLRRPAVMLPAIAALSPTLPVEFGASSDIAITPPVPLIAVGVLVWLVESVRRGSVRLPASRTTLPLLLFVGSGLLSLLAGTIYWDSFVPRAGNLILVQLAQWAIFALSAAVFWLAGELGQDVHWLRYATWAFLFVAAVFVLENYVPGLHRAVGWNNDNRVKSSISLLFTGALSIGQLLFNRNLRWFARAALCGLWAATAYVVWFIWSGWTSGLLPFTVATLVVAWLWAWRRSRVLAVAGTVVLGLAAMALYPVVFELSGGEQEMENSWGGRLVLYRAVIDLAKEHPLLGLGPAAYRQYGYTRTLSLGHGKALYVRPEINSHNNYIDIYAQMGLVGCGLFLWFIVELGIVGWRLTTRFRGDFADGYVHGALGGLAGSLVAMMLVDWFLPFVYNVGFQGFRTSALGWMFLGGLVALEQVAGNTGSDSAR
jgi:O-antigen ligase